MLMESRGVSPPHSLVCRSSISLTTQRRLRLRSQTPRQARTTTRTRRKLRRRSKRTMPKETTMTKPTRRLLLQRLRPSPPPQLPPFDRSLGKRPKRTPRKPVVCSFSRLPPRRVKVCRSCLRKSVRESQACVATCDRAWQGADRHFCPSWLASLARQPRTSRKSRSNPRAAQMAARRVRVAQTHEGLQARKERRAVLLGVSI